MPFRPLNATLQNVPWNETDIWSVSPVDLGVFYRPDVVIIALYVAVLTASLSANTLLIFIVIKFQYMRSVTNIFLVNLSVADLLVTLFCMPVQIAKSVTLLWYFGEVMCKTVNFLQGVAVASSVFTITAMSVDRYLAITQSLRQPWMPSRRGACSLLAALWFVALMIFAPLLGVAAVEREMVPLLSKTRNGSGIWAEGTIEFCTEKWPDSIRKELFGTFSFILVYAVPGCIVVVSYSLMGRRLCSVLPPFDQTEGSVNSQQRLRLVRERKRVAWILLLLAVLFALCWLPYNILQLLIDVNAVEIESVSSVLPYTLLLGHANSAINPIVYCLMTRNFRRSLRKLICHDTGNIHSSTHFHMQGLRQKSNMSSMRTCTTVTFRSSNNQLGRTTCAPSIQYGRVQRNSVRENSWKDRHMNPQFL
ncbi:QRFP-like peptide receptor [Galleria mellonella]|uniref:QRFP-like peptide receptor n=1 Tax=Galleria mellonella TaxID=7137 RepID=A0ABM3MGE4_GALME|nr:QRFP-like peptide receptor [Galleria mellonella]XP_052750487.1 QRFP-like peptide receptor [Galleria mellonella]